MPMFAVTRRSSVALVAGLMTSTACYAAPPQQTVSVPQPTAVTPSTTQLSGPSVSGTACAQQYTNYLDDLNIGGLAAQAAGVSAEAVGLLGEPFDGPAPAAGAFANAAGLATSIVAESVQHQVNQLPSCDQQFAGTVSVTTGGTNVSGDSIYNNNLGVSGDLTVGGTVNATVVTSPNPATLGGVVVGNPTNTTRGIELGGGSLSGAGTGAGAFAGDVNAIAIGNGAIAESATSVAIGTSATATGNDSTAVGSGAVANAVDGASAFGTNAHSLAEQASAFGAFSSASGVDSTALGASANAAARLATAVGQGATASGASGTAVGQSAVASGTSSTAVGQGSAASGLFSSAFGQNASASGAYSLAEGQHAVATQTNSTAVGQNAAATATSSSAFGQNSAATAQFSLALGMDSIAAGAQSTAVGAGATSAAANTIAVGANSMATGPNGVAVGNGAMATAANASAFGTNARSTGPEATALGYGSNAAAPEAVALGTNSFAAAPGSVALGTGAAAGRANRGTPTFVTDPVNGSQIGLYARATSVVSVGGGPGSAMPYRQVTNVADGAVSPTSTDAINGSQLYRLAAGLSTAILDVRREAREGIAGALSLTAAPFPTAGGKTTYAANFGFFQDATAVGGSFAHRLDTNIPIAFTGGIAVSGNGTVGGRVGMMGEF